MGNSMLQFSMMVVAEIYSFNNGNSKKFRMKANKKIYVKSNYQEKQNTNKTKIKLMKIKTIKTDNCYDYTLNLIQLLGSQ